MYILIQVNEGIEKLVRLRVEGNLRKLKSLNAIFALCSNMVTIHV
jgi:hypothetical protein